MAAMAKKNRGRKLQRFGRHLSGMVMPNIGAFIGWGLITALFIPTGWFPNEKLSQLVDPMIHYMLPLLIGYTAGKLIHGVRGAVVGTLATVGAIVGSTIPMFLGAMMMGTVGGYVIKLFDGVVRHRIRPAFEVLVDNFSVGIIGGALTIVSFLFVGPVIGATTTAISTGMQFVVDYNALALSALIIEPAKILFLNNVVDYGVLNPLGIVAAAESGKSILFLLVANPGPGLGLLLSYWAYSKGAMKQSIPGAIIIHFFGGIHEIYFPYVLMNPLTLIGVTAGGFAGTMAFSLLSVGLVATPSPGSIFALIAMTPKGNFFGVLAGIGVSAIVSFLICSIFVRKSSARDEDMEQAEMRIQAIQNPVATEE